MDYKILINKNAVPVLIEASNNADPDTWFALEDESKHIRFKDEVQVKKLIEDDLYKKEVDRCHKNCGSKERPIYPIPRKEYMTIKVGQTFPLPENIIVGFEQRCGCHYLKGPSKECLEAGGKNPYKCVKENIKIAILSPVVAPSEEVKQSFNDKGEIILPDLPQDQKDKLIEQAIETASYVLLFSMECVKVENYITGTIENNGHTYELSFKKVTPK